MNTRRTKNPTFCILVFCFLCLFSKTVRINAQEAKNDSIRDTDRASVEAGSRPGDIARPSKGAIPSSDDPSADSSADGPGTSGNRGESNIFAGRPSVSESSKSQRQDWRASARQSLLFTGIMHTFNIWTEAGTRDALNGHWFNDYLASVSELRGWSDGDTFMSPYAGHTIEGSVFGFIQRQNDPKYRRVQWGDGRVYFISLLRSMAFSAVWHTQWKIGPASEASIGNVMLHASPGFITLADTPTLGTLAMMGEDAADRYVIMGLENRTANRPLLLLARTFLNPGRSFANLMSLRLPWNREMRMGLFGNNFQNRKDLLHNYSLSGEKPFEYLSPIQNSTATVDLPKAAPIELTAFPEYDKLLGSHACIGGGGSGAARINPELQVVAALSGCLLLHMPGANQSGDSLSYGGGLRWTPRASHRFSPYVQLMFGGKKVTFEEDNIALRDKLIAEWSDGNGALPHYPKRSDWSVQIANNGPTLGIGGGFDLVLARAFAWRLLNVEYSHSWIGSIASIEPRNTVHISTGAVLRIGTW